VHGTGGAQQIRRQQACRTPTYNNDFFLFSHLVLPPQKYKILASAGGWAAFTGKMPLLAASRGAFALKYAR
jgi:hypothetical protein